MRVRVQVSPNALQTVYVAARTCYSSEGPIELLESLPDEEKMIKLIDDLIKRSHHSILEHGVVTVFIEGVSRACSHQLVRHRLMSVSQQSQRHVKKTPEFVTPYSASLNIVFHSEVKAAYDAARAAYEKLVASGMKAEEARYVLPNATATNLVVTMNFRELMHVCGVRRCARAQGEIRWLFDEIALEVEQAVPFLGSYLGPKCIMLTYCPEKDCCGMMPHKDEVLKR